MKKLLVVVLFFVGMIAVAGAWDAIGDETQFVACTVVAVVCWACVESIRV